MQHISDADSAHIYAIGGRGDGTKATLLLQERLTMTACDWLAVTNVSESLNLVSYGSINLHRIFLLSSILCVFWLPGKFKVLFVFTSYDFVG